MSTMKPKLLDLFCKQGGCSMGYHRVGFEVTGVDIDPQPNYPFQFQQADALDFLAKHGSEFDVIHASPPCQSYSAATAEYRKKGKVYVDMVADTRAALDALGKPWIMENVPRSPVRRDIELCGVHFGLRVIRWRWFEVGGGLFIMNPYPPQIIKGMVKKGMAVSVVGKGSYKHTRGDAHPVFDQGSIKKTWQYAMGIDWMDCEGLREAIPPAYTEWLGSRILEQLHTKKAQL